STVQSTSRSASSAISRKIVAFALSGSARASRRYRAARARFLGSIAGITALSPYDTNYTPLGRIDDPDIVGIRPSNCEFHDGPVANLYTPLKVNSGRSVRIGSSLPVHSRPVI